MLDPRWCVVEAVVSELQFFCFRFKNGKKVIINGTIVNKMLQFFCFRFGWGKPRGDGVQNNGRGFNSSVSDSLWRGDGVCREQRLPSFNSSVSDSNAVDTINAIESEFASILLFQIPIRGFIYSFISFSLPRS